MWGACPDFDERHNEQIDTSYRRLALPIETHRRRADQQGQSRSISAKKYGLPLRRDERDEGRVLWAQDYAARNDGLHIQQVSRQRSRQRTAPLYIWHGGERTRRATQLPLRKKISSRRNRWSASANSAWSRV